MPGLWEVVDAWGSHLLRRPREIAPFILEDGAQLTGDPSSSHGAVIDGGRVTLQPDWLYETSGAGTTVVFRKARQPKSGTFECYCTENAGSCRAFIGDNSVTCGSVDGDACLGECKIRVKTSKGRKLATRVYGNTP